MDIVEFCEKISDHPLFEFQKIFLRKLYDAAKNSNQLKKKGGGTKMSNDISTMYTKDENMKSGRKGYGLWRYEKETVISPKAYGDFVKQRRKRGKKR